MTARRVAELAAKLCVPVLAAGLVGAALLAPVRLGLTARAATPEPARAATSTTVRASEVACPGPETIGVRGVQDAAGAPAPVAVAAAVAPGAVRGPLGGVPQDVGAGTLTIEGRLGRELARTTGGPDDSALVRTRSSVAASTVVIGEGLLAPGVVAEQQSLQRSGDLRGLTSAACLAPQEDQWLVGGGGQEGRRGRLVLSNPASAPAAVSIDVLSSDGPVDRTPGASLAVGPHERVVVLLDALAPGVGAPVLRVRSTGGAVTAVLHDALLDGTTPRGTDDVVAAQAPARRVLVPAVRIPGQGSGSAVLRVAVPGGTEAVAQVRLVGEKGRVDLPGGGVARVMSSSTAEVDLSGVPAGAYAVEVQADVPVLAAVMVQRASGSGPADIAWSASAGPVAGLAGMALAGVDGGRRTDLMLTALRETLAVDVVTVLADGTASTTSVEVAGGTTRVVPVRRASTVWLRPQRGAGQLVAGWTSEVADPLGPLVTAGALREVTLTEVPADIAPIAP